MHELKDAYTMTHAVRELTLWHVPRKTEPCKIIITVLVGVKKHICKLSDGIKRDGKVKLVPTNLESLMQ